MPSFNQSKKIRFALCGAGDAGATQHDIERAKRAVAIADLGKRSRHREAGKAKRRERVPSRANKHTEMRGEIKDLTLLVVEAVSFLRCSIRVYKLTAQE